MNTAAAANDTFEPESRHDADRDVKAVAADVRADIKAAVACGALPAGLVARVRISRYSMGQSVDVSIVALPAGFALHNLARLRAETMDPHAAHYTPTDAGGRVLPWISREAIKVQDAIEAICSAYNRDRSDSQSDYYCVTFHASVAFSGELTAAKREEAQAIIRAAYAAA